MTFCTECGAAVTDGMRFCTSCGANVVLDTTPASANAAMAPAGSANISGTSTAVLTAPAQAAQAAASSANTYNPPTVLPQSAVIPATGRNAVMSTLSFIGTLLLFTVPVVGLIFCIKWAFSGTANLNRRNLSRAFFILTVVGVVCSVVFFVLFSTLLGGLLNDFREALAGQAGEWENLLGGFIAPFVQ